MLSIFTALTITSYLMVTACQCLTNDIFNDDLNSCLDMTFTELNDDRFYLDC